MRADEAALAGKDVRQHRRARPQAGEEAVAAARGIVVPGVVGTPPDQCGVVSSDFG